MARKRKKLRHLDYNSREYWNRLLAQEGMSMSQGQHPKLVYSGALDRLELVLVKRRTGKVSPKGHGPDEGHPGSDPSNR